MIGSGMSKRLPYTNKDVDYDNAKFRHRSFIQAFTQSLATSNLKRDCTSCSTGKFLLLLLVFGLAYVMLTHTSPGPIVSDNQAIGDGKSENNLITKGRITLKGLLRRPPRLPPRLPPDSKGSSNKIGHVNQDVGSVWTTRQKKVKDAFIHAWSGYKSYAMGFDELMPLSHHGVDGLGGLGATVVDALDTAMIMGIDEVIAEAGSWVEAHLAKRIRPEPDVYLDIAKNLADRLLFAFTSSPTSIPLSDVILRDSSAHPAPGGLSSTSECEGYENLGSHEDSPKVEGLVPIYISPHSGQFSGENIRLGSRGDSYYEYLIKVWLQSGASHESNTSYLYKMYVEAMKGVKHLLVRKSIPNGLVFVGELPNGLNGGFSPKMDHLVCFLPGTLALGATKGLTKEKAMLNNALSFEDIENLKLAEDLAKTCFEMYSVTSTGLAPEIAYFHTEEFSEQGLEGGNKSSEYVNDIIIKPADRHNLLRPETVESLFVLYRITEDPKYREWGWQIFKAFEKYTRVETGGYTSLDDVTSVPPSRRDKMETFFLGETLKYLYLLFGDSSVVPLDKFVFNTEAHPIPINLKK
ncbi:hypothetical protein K1719_047457 [Acacia pycnantha]|nr:hypothetical protein K1719_047457 [Acacia pycnantha]